MLRRGLASCSRAWFISRSSPHRPFSDHFKIALHARLVVSVKTGPLFKGLAHFKIVSRQCFFDHFKIVRPSAFFLGGSRTGSKGLADSFQKSTGLDLFLIGAPAVGPKRLDTFLVGRRARGLACRRGARRRLGAWLIAGGWLVAEGETADGSAVPGLRPGSCTSASLCSQANHFKIVTALFCSDLPY